MFDERSSRIIRAMRSCELRNAVGNARQIFAGDPGPTLHKQQLGENDRRFQFRQS